MSRCSASRQGSHPSPWRAKTGYAVSFTLLLGLLASPTHAAAPPGEVVLYDLLTVDPEAATQFYSELFGWEIRRSPTGSWTAALDGRAVAGIHQIEPADPDESTWIVGIEAANLDASLVSTRELGGTVYDRGAVEGKGKWAIVEDPQGAQFALIDSERDLLEATGAGTFVWAELWTDDPEAAADFYSEVIGYERSAVDRSGLEYPVFRSHGEARAGMVSIGAGTLEPGWAVYIGVAGLASTLGRVESLGGRVLLRPSSDLEGGRVAVVEDPTGVAFFVYQLEEEP
jgi:predicted enzyme related to lactoylglutathione lyase